MKPLVVLLTAFVISLVVSKLISQEYNQALCARIAMCAMLCFTAVAHFAFAKGMAMMIPRFIPGRISLVYLSGLLEIALGICLLIPDARNFAGWALIIFFIMLLPVNIKAAIEKINIETATYTGAGPLYLLFRIPLQLFFISWTYVSSIKN